MNGLKLIVADGHLDQRVQAVFGVDKAFPVAQQIADHGFAFGRRVDHLAGGLIANDGTRQPAQFHGLILQGAADFDSGCGGQGPVLQLPEPLVQGGTVTQCLPGGRIGSALLLGVAKQLVGGSEDILDFRAVLGFQQRQQIDQQTLIRQQFSRLLELGKCGPSRDTGFENRPGFYRFHRGWQGRQGVVGLSRLPVHLCESAFYRHRVGNRPKIWREYRHVNHSMSKEVNSIDIR